jgi:hypothetical protein|tara:strand:+ start:5410 stop:5745 length:336 start_codon:yes stop_codon:yes gene_type:complete
MEFGARELLTFATVLAGLAGTWAVIKSTVARIQEDLKLISKELVIINNRLDATESGDAVMKHQVSVLGGMLSPTEMEKRSRELESLQQRLAALRRDCDGLIKIHNGKHPSN